MSVSRDFLLSAYERCSKHLEGRSTKYDQTMAFYLVIILFYFGSYSTISKLLVNLYSPVFFNVVACLISGMAIKTLSGLRSWHMQYTNSALTLSKVISKNISELDILNLEIRSFFDKKEEEYHEVLFAKMFSDTKNRVIPGMTLISGFPAAMLVKEAMSLLKVSSREIIVLAECAFYLVYVVYYFYNTVMVIHESANYKTWIVNFE